MQHSRQLALTLLFVSVALFFASMSLFPFATLAPCGNRGWAYAMIAVNVIGILVGAPRKPWAAEDTTRTMRIGVMAFCGVALALNIVFLLYSHWLCARMTGG